jgi:hypothetical protein
MAEVADLANRLIDSVDLHEAKNIIRATRPFFIENIKREAFGKLKNTIQNSLNTKKIAFYPLSLPRFSRSRLA